MPEKNARFEVSPLGLLAVIYVAMPLIAATVFFATSTPETRLLHTHVRLVPAFIALAVILAVLSGLQRTYLHGLLSRAEQAAVVLLVAVFLGTALFVAISPVDALARGGHRVLLALTGIALVFLLSQEWRRPDLLSLALILQPLAHLPLLIALYLIYAGSEPPGINWLGGPPGYWHVRIWGMTLAAAAAAAFGLYVGAERRPHALAFVALTLLSAMLAWSGSRGSIVGLLGGILLTALVFPRRTLSALPVTAVALLLGALLSLIPMAPLYPYGLLGGVAETLSAGDLNGASAGRLGMWRDALGLIADRPLFGHGHDQYVLIYEDGPIRATHPHNALVQILIDWGLVGGAAALFLLFSLWWRGTARIRAEGAWTKLSGFAVLATMAGASMFDGVLYHEGPLLIVAIAYAILFARPLEPARSSG
ncbi:MAG: O-antigen ligase family protein [Pseudomonadota bacterium]